MRTYFKAFQSFFLGIQKSAWYSLIFVFLAVVSVLLLIYEHSPWADEQWVNMSQHVDIFIAYVFLIDFCLGIVFTLETKKSYMKQNWLNLMSSIPLTSDVTRVLRILRLVQAYRVFRAAVDVMQLASQLKKRR